MKDMMSLLCFGAGVVAGALIYKHSQDAKKLVNKGEKAVKQEVEMIKDSMQQTQNDSKQKKQATLPIFCLQDKLNVCFTP